MKGQKHPSENGQEGYVLITALLILVILTIIGIAATSTTTLELKIAGNDKAMGEAFHKADGALETTIELLEQNIRCPTGFTLAPASFDSDDPATFFSIGAVNIFENNFALNEVMDDLAGAVSPDNLNLVPSDTIRTLRVPADPANPNDTDIHSNMVVWGKTEYIAGAAIQVASGYEGKGKGAAGGGGAIMYQVHAQHVGKNNSESVVALEWRHIISNLVGCQY